jgi:hypothetical protein
MSYERFIRQYNILGCKNSVSGSKAMVIYGGKACTDSYFADILRFGIVESLQWNEYFIFQYMLDVTDNSRLILSSIV